jgi:dihydrofolate reductase
VRRIVLYIAESLDGCIARPDGSLDWLDAAAVPGEDYGYGEFLASCDTLLVGGVTFRQLLGFGEYPYTGKRVYVFTRQGPVDVPEGADTAFVDTEPADLARRLLDEPGDDIWLVGGSAIIQPIMDAGLVDEIILSIIPVVLGDGIPLFAPGTLEKRLELLDERSYPGGIVQLRYRPS